jgi:hypothetical protein
MSTEPSSYNAFKLSFLKRNEGFKQFGSFSAQVFFMSALMAPLDRIKILLQVQPQLNNYGYKNINSTKDIINRIHKNGLNTFFKGTRIIFIRNLFNYMFNAKMYKTFEKRINNYEWAKDMGIFKDLICSTYSCLLTYVLTYPLDVIKTKQQIELAPKADCKYLRIFWSYKYITTQ